MIEAVMYIGIGFLAATLLALVVIPLVHDRAVRLTSRRLNAAIPMSMVEMHAVRDQMRAELAVTVCRLETNLEQVKEKAASLLAEVGNKTDTINRLKLDLGEKTVSIFALEKSNNALRVQLSGAEAAALNGRHADHLLAKKVARVQAESDARSILADVNGLRSSH